MKVNIDLSECTEDMRLKLAKETKSKKALEELSNDLRNCIRVAVASNPNTSKKNTRQTF